MRSFTLAQFTLFLLKSSYLLLLLRLLDSCDVCVHFGSICYINSTFSSPVDLHRKLPAAAASSSSGSIGSGGTLVLIVAAVE